MRHSTVTSMDSLLEKNNFPADCPICGRREAHVYLRAYTPKRGDLWTWCSSCQSFEHASIIPPSDWKNDDFIDYHHLSALPQYLEFQKDSIDSYMTKNYKGLDSDLCIGCIRNEDFSNTACPSCRRKDITVRLEGHTLILKCKSCGYEVTGASFYSPCKRDTNLYHLLIHNTHLPAEVIVKLSRQHHSGVLDIKKQIKAREKLNPGLRLNEIMNVSLYLDDKAISYDVFPFIRYSKYYKCGHFVR